MISKLFFGIFAVFASCDRPHRGVMIVREADHHVVSVLNCGDPKWAHPPVWEINVRKSPWVEEAAVQCTLRVSFKERGEDSDSLTQWRYNSQPKGYVLEHCAALEPDTTYEINVLARPGPVKGHFTVASNGDVTMIDGTCPK